MSLYIQLGTSGSFVAPASGQLILQCEDTVRSDDSGSLPVSINGVAYTALASSDVNGPVLVGGQTYTYSCPSGSYWNGGAGNVYFNADGQPKAGNDSPFAVQQSIDGNGMRPFSLVGRIDNVVSAAAGNHLFSTGTLTATYNGTTYTIAVIQDIDFEAMFESKMLHDAVIVGRFPIDIAFGDGSFTMKVTNADVDITNLQLLAAAVVQTENTAEFPGTGLQEILDGKLDLPSLALVFQGKSTSGKLMVLTANNVSAKGFSWPLKRDDWTMQSFELTAIADSSGVVATYGVAT